MGDRDAGDGIVSVADSEIEEPDEVDLGTCGIHHWLYGDCPNCRDDEADRQYDDRVNKK